MTTEDVVDALMDQTTRLTLALEEIKSRIGILIVISLIPWILTLLGIIALSGD